MYIGITVQVHRGGTAIYLKKNVITIVYVGRDDWSTNGYVCIKTSK